MKISDIVLFRVTGEFPGTDFPAGNRQAKMLDVYPEFDQEGRSSGGRHPCTPWGVPTKGHKTRKKSRSQKYIVKRRGKK